MIACDSCDEWFHGECVNLTEEQAKAITKFVCKQCKETGKAKNGKGAAGEEGSSAPVSPPTPEGQSSAGKKCTLKDCNNLAQPGSKYCSKECGMKNAQELLKQKSQLREENAYQRKLEQLKQAISTNSDQVAAADVEDVKKLEEINTKRDSIQEQIASVEEKQRELEKQIKFAEALYGTAQDSGQEDKAKSSSLDIIDCITCGQPIPSAQYARHVEQCTNKVSNPAEKSRKSGKEQSEQLCGCPTSETPEGHCRKSKKDCQKHVNWENIRRNQLSQEKLRQESLLQQLLDEEKLIHQRLQRRSEAQIEANRTIVA